MVRFVGISSLLVEDMECERERRRTAGTVERHIPPSFLSSVFFLFLFQKHLVPKFAHGVASSQNCSNRRQRKEAVAHSSIYFQSLGNCSPTRDAPEARWRLTHFFQRSIISPSLPSSCLRLNGKSRRGTPFDAHAQKERMRDARLRHVR